ncbi:type II toxin-antitoxin system RelE/ParE family toxin [Rhizobium sp. TRM95111]|uniref:type II toxin-antitoxin system RelE/ParE family toxin n=1 Tax=Rhizobium alarense TaxID=2846851 RepID=UPI001F2EF70D|nr:type II toxin-antitoxin system RelE/ParE family toxin [Rhizobium alarense]MCF3638521.1 type II toxin-antitoxin system RelE/ParE family toxin [Rhizobium alarense]
MINAAKALDDLRMPPESRLDLLKGDPAGFYAIRISDRRRICFAWSEGGASDVKILDDHR